jgi:hypothetical protein
MAAGEDTKMEPADEAAQSNTTRTAGPGRPIRIPTLRYTAGGAEAVDRPSTGVRARRTDRTRKDNA